MAAVDRTIKLPSGQVITARVPEEWGKDEVRAALESKGVDFRLPGEGGGQPVYDDMPSFDEEQRAPVRKQKEDRDALQVVAGIGETTLATATGFTTGALGTAAGALWQIGKEMYNGDFGTQAAVGRIEEAAMKAGEAVTYMPRTEAGMEYTAEVGEVMAANLPAFTPVTAEMEAIAASASAAMRMARANKRARITAKDVDESTPVPVPAPVRDEIVQKVNAAADAAEVQRATLENLVPDLAKDSVDVARAKSQMARKQFDEDLKAIFKDDAERKDFIDRVIKKKIEDKRTDDMAPIEVQRARARMGVREQRDQEIMQKIRDRQEAEVAKMEAERTTPPTQPIRDAVKAPQLAEIRRNENILRTAHDDVSVLETFGQKTIKRMEAIAPRISTAVRRVTTTSNRRINERVETAKVWLQDKGIQKAIRKDPEYKAAVLNRDLDTMERIVPGSAKKYEPVAKMLDEYQARMKADGKPIIEDGIHPRAVINVEKLRRDLDRPTRDLYQKARRTLMDKKGRDYLTEHEEAGLIGQFVGGHPVKTFKGRSIRTVTPEASKHYMHPDISLVDYIHAMEENLATKDFFRNTLGKDVPVGDALNAQQLRGHLGEVLAKGVRDGDLSSGDITNMAELLNAHFGAGRQGPGKILQKAKDFFTGLTIGWNPLSTATQIADVGISAARFGPINTIKAQFGPKVAGLMESGLRNAAAEMRNPHSFAQWFAKNGLRRMGFDKIDRLGNKVALNAGYRARWQQAIKSEGKLYKELEPLFGAKDAKQIIADLKARKYTDDVATLMAHDIADIRPIGREDMPLSYNKNPNGRTLYSLLSWSVNQFNFVRNTAFRDIQQGLRSGNVKMVGKGVAALTGMLAVFGLANVPAGVTKDLMQGKELDPVAHFAAGTVPFGMSGKFLVEQLMSYDPARAAGNMLPLVGITANAIGGVLSGAVEGDIPKIIQATPAGRSLYRIITGDGIDIVLGGVGAVGSAFIPDAGAAYAMQPTQLPEGAEELPAEAIPVERNLPAGWEPLPPPPTEKLGDQYTSAVEHVTQREGNRSQSYKDSLGKLTGGIGHLLTEEERKKYPEGTPIPQDVRDRWFKKDLSAAFDAARKQAEAINRPDMVTALTSVNFQLGTDWNSKFKNTWKALTQGDWTTAAMEAANSKWNDQTPVRVKDFQSAILQAIE